MALPKSGWTEAEYLAFERASDIKHELMDGEVRAMSGANERHNLIVASTLASLFTQLRGKGCKIYPSDMRVRVGLRREFTYPDLSIVCGMPIMADDYNDTLLNPTVIIEVLSASTESYDRGRKFTRYRTIESLQEYILIAQDYVQIERFVRQANNQWLLTDLQRVDGIIELMSVGCTLAAADVYEQVTFENSPPPET